MKQFLLFCHYSTILTNVSCKEKIFSWNSCFISECDTNGNLTSKSGQFPNAVFGNLTFEPPWLPNVVPYKHEKPTKCRRYERRPSENTTHLRSARGDKCPADDYNHAVEVKCDRFVYKTDEVTILNEVRITKHENPDYFSHVFRFFFFSSVWNVMKIGNWQRSVQLTMSLDWFSRPWWAICLIAMAVERF